ncbi:Bug family tripartite tricarboxylate transporter substrate binding protein [Caldimonas thermodepolymerans]|uniref:Bug family tripartite tricarboxylate transporter substrate binding protein n=1 Tax=Caldimonas thermodepolymerans TaxID=215580 RepID=UPI002235431E|nr:tripartite tricarboxylate transporter substrate binding protein [Caldimonas thermodepolymerans]UZG44389.1 tripartite tricarboxylate transporter substrate binding protein [Caldimonas thermodepolymerans]
MSLNRRDLLLATAGLAVATRPWTQAAFPSKPIQWIVPYAAGGGTDIVARTVAEQMGAALGQTIVVDNKPGANTAIGASALARSPADGYTVGSADNATLALNQHLFNRLTYTPEKDFAFVGGLARFPYALLVHPDQPFRTFKELVQAGKSKPGSLSYGSPGLGGPNHVAMELLQQRTGATFVHVPYRGAAPGLQDLISGQIQFMLVDTASSMQFIKAGRVRALAVSMPERLAALPDVPTVHEAGLPNFEAYSWQGMIVPTGTPAPVIQRLSQELMKAVNSVSVGKRLAEIGVEPAPSSSEEFAKHVKDQAALWGDVIRSANIRLES